MSNIQRINDYTVLSDEEFFEKYNQTKEEFLKEWEEENNKGVIQDL
ncbi:MAG: hypothetical protein J6M65_13145 [Eubacterium sp.]|nr:hypothetical protein [Eubacterium sp.]